MDEEDLREAEESKMLQTAEGYAGFGSTETDATRRAGLVDLLKTGGETMGVKLLKKMGWREGQGIGPKVRRKANLGDRAATGGEGAEQTYLFAPENPPMVAFIRKTDLKGLGFEGEARLEERLETPRGKPDEEGLDSFFEGRLALQGKSKTSKAKETRRGGFGVGILNDTGSDDEDPYSLGPQISYSKTIGGDKKKKKKEGKPAIASSNPLLNSKPVFISKKVAAARSAGGSGNAVMADCHLMDLFSQKDSPVCLFLQTRNMSLLKFQMVGNHPKCHCPRSRTRQIMYLLPMPPKLHLSTRPPELQFWVRPNYLESPSSTG